MVPTPVYDNETVPTPNVTMVELVFGPDGVCIQDDFKCLPDDPCEACLEPVCQVCADRGVEHIPEDDFETYSRED